MTTEQDDLQLRADAASAYMLEGLNTFQRAIAKDFLTPETAINTLLCVASLLCKAHLGEAAGAMFLERQAKDLAANMRAKQQPLN